MQRMAKKTMATNSILKNYTRMDIREKAKNDIKKKLKSRHA